MVDEMNNLQLGKMYLVKEYFWFLFPKKELVEAISGMGRAASSKERAEMNAKWLSEHYKCNVFVVEENTYVVLLEVVDDYYKLLDSNGNIGWTYCCDDFSRYFKIVKG